MRNPLTPITPPRRVHSICIRKIAFADGQHEVSQKECTTQLLHTTKKTAKRHSYKTEAELG